MSQECIGGEQNSGDRILLMRVKLNVRIHIREIQEAAIKDTAANIAILAAICALQTSLPIRVTPNPVLEFGNHFILLFQHFDRLRLVNDPCFRIGVYCIENSQRFHIQDIFQQTQHFHTLRTVNLKAYVLVLAMLMTFSEAGLFRDIPNTGGLIVTYRIFVGEKLFGLLRIYTLHRVQPNHMQNELIDHISRHPGRTKCNVDLIGGQFRTDQILQCLHIGIKIAVIGFVGFQRQRIFVHQIAGKILVCDFPALIKALVPVKRVLEYAALQSFDDRFHLFTGNGRNKFNIYHTQRIHTYQQAFCDGITMDIGANIVIKSIGKVHRQVHCRDLLYMLQPFALSSPCGSCFCGSAALFFLFHFLLQKFRFTLLALPCLSFLDIQLSQFQSFQRNINILSRKHLAAGLDVFIKIV